MSSPARPAPPRRIMTEERIADMLARGFCGRLATVGKDGEPHCTPLLYIWMDGELYCTPRAHPATCANIAHEPRVCFAIDEADGVFDYSRFECDSGLAFRSVVLFGRIRTVEEKAIKQQFCEALMEKFGKGDTGRPKGFFPRLDIITVDAVAVERMTGKEMDMPALSQQWPAVDRTKTPDARA